MDPMLQFYMEETEDLLQKAEECIIRIETEYSAADINELFRIAHTIKGSSHMVGYDDIGEIMHKIEDMLDCVRNGSIAFDKRIVTLCFEGLDIVEKMLLHKKDQNSGEMAQDLIDAALGICEKVVSFIRMNKKEEEASVSVAHEQTAGGLVASLLNKEPKGKNKFYITFFVEEDAPMISPVILMILKSVEDIGSLLYSSITDKYLSGCSGDDSIKTLDIIISTDIEEAELYTYFALPYVERINIVDLTRSRLEENDYYFKNVDDTFYINILGIFAQLYDLLSRQPQELMNGAEALKSIESLHEKAIAAFEKMKSKSKIRTFFNDLNDFFSNITQKRNGQEANNKEFVDNIRKQLLKLMERASNYAKGKYIYTIFKPDRNHFVDRLKNFMEMVNKSSTYIILIDLSKLDILHEDEVKALVEVKKQLEERGIEIGVIAEEPEVRRIANIFDSIKPVEEFRLFMSESDAVMTMLYSQDLLLRIAGNGCLSPELSGF